MPDAIFVDVDVGFGVPLADGKVLCVRGESAAPELTAEGAQNVETDPGTRVPDPCGAIPRDGCDLQVIRAHGSPHYGIFVSKQLVSKAATLHVPYIDARKRSSFTRSDLGRLVMTKIYDGFAVRTESGIAEGGQVAFKAEPVFFGFCGIGDDLFAFSFLYGYEFPMAVQLPQDNHVLILNITFRY